MKRALSALVLVGAVGCSPGGTAPPASAPGAAPTPSAATPQPFPSTYPPFPSQPTLIRGGTVMTAAGEVIPNGQVLMVDGKIAAVGATVNAPAGATGGGRHREVRDAGADRHPLAPGRVPEPGRGRALERERGDQPDDARGLGGALGVAAGPGLRARAGGRDHHAADPAGLRQPDRRSERGAQERALAHGAGDEVPGRAVRDEDGVRREPEAGLRKPRRPLHADGQRGRLPRGVHQGAGVQEPLGRVGEERPRPRRRCRPATSGWRR